MQNSQPRFPEEQRNNLTHKLFLSLQREIEDQEVSYDRAFIHVALNTLGYDLQAGVLCDGRGDFGIDFCIVDEKAATIFQFKSHDYTDYLNSSYRADSKMISDLPRIYSQLEDLDSIPTEANSKVQAVLKELRSSVHRYTGTPHSKESAYEVTVFFCVLAQGFTAQAQQEFDRLAGGRAINWNGQQINVSTIPIFLDELIAEDWRESNTDWRTSSGQKNDKAELSVCGEMIASASSLVFFTKAHDLVQAFDRFGYQMFEPNVRCELKRSKVNQAIRDSIKASRGRRDFKYLNNGITLICANFQKIRRSTSSVVSVTQPGVINGLQTVKAIHDAYDELDSKSKEEFSRDCEVLVRLHTRNAVHDYKQLVVSTNNQNPMQARNLKSNEPEQAVYERLFADLNWFYERKEGAWKAYRSDSKLWGSLRGKKEADFRSIKPGVVKNIDNLEMAQAWLSFIGFSNEVIHHKREIFTDDKKYYEMVFKKRVAKHGYDYNFSFSDPGVMADAADQAPSPHALLLAQLLREIADGLTPSRRQHREDCVKRLRIEKLNREEQDAKLGQDSTYIRGLVLAGAKYLFVDFCGLVLFRALGDKVYDGTERIFRTKSMRPMFAEKNLEPLRAVLQQDQFEERDVIAVIWSLYLACLENIIEMASWRQQFEQAAVRSRFNYSDYNRKMLMTELDNQDRVYQRRAIQRPWSEGIEKHKGIFSYVASVCS